MLFAAANLPFTSVMTTNATHISVLLGHSDVLYSVGVVAAKL